MTDQRISYLINCHLNGQIKEEEKAELEAILRNHAAARRQFWQETRIHGLLHELDEQTLIDSPVETGANIKTRRFSRLLVRAIAAVLLIGVSIAGFHQYSTRSHIASLTYESMAHWDHGSCRIGQGLPSGPYTLLSGLAQLTMADQSIVTLSGPATFELINRETIYLHSGKLSARVNNPESKFTVQTNHLNVLDLGTSFGVNVQESGASTISVFEGEVEVKTRLLGINATEGMTLSKGQVVTSDGIESSTLKEVVSDHGLFNDLWPLTSGVQELSNLIHYLPPIPTKSLLAYKDDSHLFMMPERHSVRLENRLTIDLREGTFPDRMVEGEIEKNTLVSSYIIFFNKMTRIDFKGRPHMISGSIQFANKILGVITSDEKLLDSDDVLAVPDLEYRGIRRKKRGLEHRMTKSRAFSIPQDTVRIGPNGNDIYFNLNLGDQVDQFRVIVAAD